MISVYGIGNPLMDVIGHGDFQLISDLGTRPGTMHLIQRHQVSEICEKIEDTKNVPGGSCANTMRGIAWLSKAIPCDPPHYSGAVGNDGLGREYKQLMEDFGVSTSLVIKSNQTGISHIIVTPDHERTMFTFLGACQEYDESCIDFDALGKAQYLYITGYMWSTEGQKKAVKKAIDFARDKRKKVVFDLADPFVVNCNRDNFLSCIPQKIDILFGNKEEYSLLIGEKPTDKEIISSAQSLAGLVIMKVSAKGCYYMEKNDICFEPGRKVKAVDTTGAGDSFASGFLFGLLKNKPLKECASLANTLAASIVTVEGCNYSLLDQKEILEIEG